MKNPPLLLWLNNKLADAEQSLRARESLAESFERTADPKFWDDLSKMPGVIVTKTYRGRKGPTAEQNKESAASQRRIAEKCRHEVEMFKATIEALTP